MTEQNSFADSRHDRDRDAEDTRIAADPEAEEANSPKAETSSTLTYLGFGIPLIVLISTGIFGIANGHPFLVFLGFGVAAVLLVIAILVIVKLVRANRHRSHH